MDENKKDILYSYYRIRKLIGLLGIILPALVAIVYGGFLSSISHYYYTKSSVIFISILSALGLFLISYKGYKRDKETERLSDNFITHIGGVAVLLVVIFPTYCSETGSSEIYNICLSEAYPLFGHRSAVVNVIHLVSAGTFFITMGWMSIYRFTKRDLQKGLTKEKQNKNKIYRFCGYTIWISMGILLVEFSLKIIYPDFNITNYDVFILETISIIAFGISWLIKGEAIKDIIDLKNKCFRILKVHKEN